MAMGVNAEGGVASHNLQRKTLIFVSLVIEIIKIFINMGCPWGIRGHMRRKSAGCSQGSTDIA